MSEDIVSIEGFLSVVNALLYDAGYDHISESPFTWYAFREMGNEVISRDAAVSACFVYGGIEDQLRKSLRATIPKDPRRSGGLHIEWDERKAFIDRHGRVFFGRLA